MYGLAHPLTTSNDVGSCSLLATMVIDLVLVVQYLSTVDVVVNLRFRAIFENKGHGVLIPLNFIVLNEVVQTIFSKEEETIQIGDYRSHTKNSFALVTMSVFHRKALFNHNQHSF